MRSAQPSQHNLVFYFQVHQPLRLKPFRFFDIGSGSQYFNDDLNKEITERVARTCYLPANTLLLKLIQKYPQIKVAFSISGVTLDQLKEYAPEVLDSFKALAKTGSVEFFSETNYHSLACMMPGDEFENQIIEHAEKLYEHFGVRPTVFRNTELIYNDEIGKRVSMLGFNGIFCDGIEQILGGRNAHQLYHHPEEKGLRLFLRHYRLSDDIAFRFTQGGTPLTAEKYMSWLNSFPEDQPLVNVALDYETFGEHQKHDSGIFNFMENLLTQLAHSEKYRMLTPSEAIRSLNTHGPLPVSNHISWADQERDLSAWLGNALQRDAFDTLANLEKDIKALGNIRLLKIWRYLQTSDHFYYMCTKKDDDGNVHAYFSPYPSPYEAFMNYMNVLSDFSLQVGMQKITADVLSKESKAEPGKLHFDSFSDSKSY